MGKFEVEQYLTSLAVKNKVSLAIQSQAFFTLLFFFIKVLGIDMSEWNIQEDRRGCCSKCTFWSMFQNSSLCGTTLLTALFTPKPSSLYQMLL